MSMRPRSCRTRAVSRTDGDHVGRWTRISHIDAIRKWPKDPHPVERACHHLGLHGASDEPKGRFLITVKARITPPSAHHQTGLRPIRTGSPFPARTIQTVHSTAKTAYPTTSRRVGPEGSDQIAVRDGVGAAQTAAGWAVDAGQAVQRADGVVAGFVRVDQPHVREGGGDPGEGGERREEPHGRAGPVAGRAARGRPGAWSPRNSSNPRPDRARRGLSWRPPGDCHCSRRTTQSGPRLSPDCPR